MLYVQTNETNEVVLAATNPLDPVYGLGKTEEELRATGFFFEFLEELPTPVKRDGYRAITHCDGEKFWFTYKEMQKVDLEQMVLRLESLRQQDAAKNKEIARLKNDLAAANASILETQGAVVEQVSAITEQQVLSATQLAGAIQQVDMDAKDAVELAVRRVDENEGKVEALITVIPAIEGEVKLTKEELSKAVLELTKKDALIAETKLELETRLSETTGAISQELQDTAIRLEDENRMNGDAIAAVHTANQETVSLLNHEKTSRAQEIEAVRVETDDKVALTNERVSLTEETVAVTFMEIFDANMKIADAGVKLTAAEEALLVAQGRMSETDARILEHDDRMEMTNEVLGQQSVQLVGAEMMVAESFLQLITMQMEAMATAEEIVAAKNELALTNENVLAAKQQLVTTGEELSRTQEELMQTQAELAALFLMMLEGGMTT